MTTNNPFQTQRGDEPGKKQDAAQQRSAGSPWKQSRQSGQQCASRQPDQNAALHEYRSARQGNPAMEEEDEELEASASDNQDEIER